MAIDPNRIHNGDDVQADLFDGWVEVRYINHSEGWVEVSDEEDTFRMIVTFEQITAHRPL